METNRHIEEEEWPSNLRTIEDISCDNGFLEVQIGGYACRSNRGKYGPLISFINAGKEIMQPGDKFVYLSDGLDSHVYAWLKYRNGQVTAEVMKIYPHIRDDRALPIYRAVTDQVADLLENDASLSRATIKLERPYREDQLAVLPGEYELTCKAVKHTDIVNEPGAYALASPFVPGDNMAEFWDDFVTAPDVQHRQMHHLHPTYTFKDDFRRYLLNVTRKVRERLGQYDPLFLCDLNVKIEIDQENNKIIVIITDISPRFSF